MKIREIIVENDEEDMFGHSDRVGNDLRRATYQQRIPSMVKMIHGDLDANTGSLVKQIAAELGRDADVFRRDPEIFDLANGLTSEIAAQVSNILMNLDPVMINDEDALNNALSDYTANIRAESELWNYIEEVLGDDAELDDSYACAMTIEGEIGALLLKLIQQAYNQFSLAETFDNPYKGKWEKSDYGDVDLNTKLPDGTYLNIMFNQEYGDEGEEVVQVEFHRNNSQDVTGEGDAQRIFATVLDAIQKYIKKYKPQRLSFSASKAVDMDADDVEHFNPESRAKLYDRLVQRYARAWGYRAFRADNGDIVIYELSRLGQGLAEAKTTREDFEGMTIEMVKNGHVLVINALDDWGNNILGSVAFNIGDDNDLDPQDLKVDERYQGQGIARIMYDYVKSKGYTIHRSYDQTDAGAGFWNKHRGEDVRVWENFHDGRNPQDKGDSKRYGVPTKASISTLRKVAKQGGRKGQLAHWMANMKAGRAKKK